MYLYEEIKNVHLELTEHCQAKCLHCFRFKDGKINPYLKMSELSLEDIKHLMPVDFLSQLDTIELKGNYGDAIIAKDCLPIIEYFRKSNPSLNIILVTNGGARSSSWWEELARLIGKNGQVTFSVDGLKDTNHIYRKNVQWDIVLNSMKSFIGAGGKAQWDYIIFEHNEHQFKEAHMLSKELGFDSIRFKKSYRFANFFHLPPTVRPPKNNSLMNNQLKILKQEKDSIIKNNDGIVCKAISKKEIYISAEGLLFPCCWLSGALYYPNSKFKDNDFWDLIVDTDCINAKKYGLKNIFNSPIFFEIEQTWAKKNSIYTCRKKCGQNSFEDFDVYTR